MGWKEGITQRVLAGDARTHFSSVCRPAALSNLQLSHVRELSDTNFRLTDTDCRALADMHHVSILRRLAATTNCWLSVYTHPHLLGLTGNARHQLSTY